MHHSLFNPYITNNIESLFGASEYMLERVDILQRKSLKAVFIFLIINKQIIFSSKTISLLDDILKVNLSISMFNYTKYPTSHRYFISSCISFNSVKHKYQTRNNSNLSVVSFNRASYCFSVIICIPKYKKLEHFTNESENNISSANFIIKLKSHFCFQY